MKYATYSPENTGIKINKTDRTNYTDVKITYEEFCTCQDIIVISILVLRSQVIFLYFTLFKKKL